MPDQVLFLKLYLLLAPLLAALSLHKSAHCEVSEDPHTNWGGPVASDVLMTAAQGNDGDLVHEHTHQASQRA